MSCTCQLWKKNIVSNNFIIQTDVIWFVLKVKCCWYMICNVKMAAMINDNSSVLCQLVMISLQSQGSRSRHWQTGQPKCQGHLIPPEPLPSVTIDKFSVGPNNNCFEEEKKRCQRWLFLKKKIRLPLKSGLPRSLVAVGRPAAACRPAPQCRLQSPRGLPQNFNLGPASSCSCLLYLKLYFLGLIFLDANEQMIWVLQSLRCLAQN